MTPVAGIWSIGPSPHFRESSRRREEETMTNPFVPILIMFGLAALLAVGGVAASSLIDSNRHNELKLVAHELAIHPTRHAAEIPFPNKFFLVPMTFIIFDIEVVFLYPWAVAFRELVVFGLIAMLTFLLLIAIPFIYE